MYRWKKVITAVLLTTILTMNGNYDFIANNKSINKDSKMTNPSMLTIKGRCMNPKNGNKYSNVLIRERGNVQQYASKININENLSEIIARLVLYYVDLSDSSKSIITEKRGGIYSQIEDSIKLHINTKADKQYYIYDKDGKLVDKIIIDDDGSGISSNLDVGKYKIVGPEGEFNFEVSKKDIKQVFNFNQNQLQETNFSQRLLEDRNDLNRGQEVTTKYAISSEVDSLKPNLSSTQNSFFSSKSIVALIVFFTISIGFFEHYKNVF